MVNTDDYNGPNRRNNVRYVGITWLVGVLVTVVGFGSAMWVSTVEGRFSESQETRLMGFSRLSAVEEAVKGITSRLDRIEGKLDRALR